MYPSLLQPAGLVQLLSGCFSKIPRNRVPLSLSKPVRQADLRPVIPLTPSELLCFVLQY